MAPVFTLARWLAIDRAGPKLLARGAKAVCSYVCSDLQRPGVNPDTY